MAEVGDEVGVFLEGGQRVQVRVRTHEHYGLFVDIVGHEGITGSIDWLDIAGPDRDTLDRATFRSGLSSRL